MSKFNTRQIWENINQIGTIWGGGVLIINAWTISMQSLIIKEWKLLELQSTQTRHHLSILDQPGTKIAISILVRYWHWQETFYFCLFMFFKKDKLFMLCNLIGCLSRCKGNLPEAKPDKNCHLFMTTWPRWPPCRNVGSTNFSQMMILGWPRPPLKWPPCQYMVIHLKYFWKLKINDFGTWFVALGCWVCISQLNISPCKIG